MITLGQSADNSQDQFQGELSKIDLFNRVLTSQELSDMASVCRGNHTSGDVKRWAEFDEVMVSDVIKVIPSICGSSNCPPGFRGSLCDIKIGK